MNEQTAKEILENAIDDIGLFDCCWYLAWATGENKATLDGKFTAEELEAIAFWMRKNNHGNAQN